MKMYDLVKQKQQTVFDAMCPYCEEIMTSRVKVLLKTELLGHILGEHIEKVIDVTLEENPI